jgi:molybdopterin/thiamine biosynthesis adenylyltransferase
MWVPDFGVAGQTKLAAASVLVSRLGGVGGAAALYLAAAGVGRLVLAHAGNLTPPDLNRQMLMTHDWLGRPRVLCAAQRLRDLNPDLVIETHETNISAANAHSLAADVDLIVSAAPRFEERLALNAAAVQHRIPLVDCAMYEMDAQLTCVVPGQSACLACLYPETPPVWKRQFPVFGAVAGTIGAWGAMEAIKLLSGLGTPLTGRMLMLDLRQGMSRQFNTIRNPTCAICGGL